MLGALAGLAGSVVSGLFGNKQASDNIKYQKQFAKTGIQWRVEDAKKAGIHPLAALGANTHSFAPVQGGDWSGLASAGQDLGRAIEARTTEKQRVDGYAAELRKLQLERGRLENDVLRADLASRVAKVKQPGNPPAVADAQNPNLIPGQGNSPGIENKPMERQGWDDANPQREAGVISDTGYSWTGTGYAPNFSKDFMDRAEDDMLGKAAWYMRNRIPQSFQQNLKPPFAAPPGHFWSFHPYYQEYRLKEYIRGPGRFSARQNAFKR